MLKHFSILALAIITSIHSASAQPTLVNKKINDSFTKTENKQSFILKSKYTSHEYLIQVALPTTNIPQEGFPVLYLLDGNASFGSAANIAKSVGASANKLGLSPVAVVAIGYPNQSTFDVEKRALDYTPKASAKFQSEAKYKYGGADQFFQFIEKELKPEIESRINVNTKQQSLFGHSFGGLFVLHTIFAQPQSFQRYIAASPSLWFDDYVLLEKQNDWLNKKDKTEPMMLMTTVGTHEHRKNAIPDLQSQQKQNHFYQNFKNQRTQQFLYWDFKHPAEQHLTNMYASLPKAIMLAGCQLESCANLFDEPIQENDE